MNDRLSRAMFLGIATWRGTHLLQKDTITQPLRDNWLYPHFPAKGQVYASTKESEPVHPPSAGWIESGTYANGNPRYVHPTGTFIGRLFACPWCLSIWVAIALTARRPRWNIVRWLGQWFVDVLATAGVAMLAKSTAHDG